MGLLFDERRVLTTTDHSPFTESDYAGSHSDSLTNHSDSLIPVTFLLNNILKFSSYLTGNTLRFRYKRQPVIAV
jgi:hypothetical protein